MLYPSIQELLAITAKDGKERLNKYSITMATAKCARVITNDYAEQSYMVNKMGADKETLKKEYKDEKSVKNALYEMKAGEFEVYLPGEEGYEESLVEIENYEEPKEEPIYIDIGGKKTETEVEEDFDAEELMGATEEYEEDQSLTIKEGDEE